MGENGLPFVSPCSCAEAPDLCPRNDEYVTQLTDPSGDFRDGPRSRERDLSVLRGQLTVTEALKRVVQTFGPEKVESSSVRYANVGVLRDSGFVVWHTPRRRIKNDIHASIMVRSGEEHVSPWSKGWQSRLAECFNEGEKKE